MQVPDHTNNSLQILLSTSLRTLRGLQLRLGLGLSRLLVKKGLAVLSPLVCGVRHELLVVALRVLLLGGGLSHLLAHLP